MVSVQNAAQSMRQALAGASEGLVERELLLELVALAAVAGEHVLIIGPPGTAKSAAVRRVGKALGLHYFEYLLGRFTEPSELFGPVDLRKLRDGTVETDTAGMLPEAEVAFLDEVFLGSTAILNTLLGILNERRFVRGHTRVDCPLRVCVGAANSLPDDEALAAFADRFVLRAFVEPIADPRLEELLAAGRHAETHTQQVSMASATELDTLIRAAREADVAAIRSDLADALRVLRSAGIALSDRRCVKIQNLVAAACVLDGRKTPTVADLWPIVFAVPDAEAQALARDALRDLLESSHSEALPAAAEEASLGPIARATRLERAGEDAFAGRDDAPDTRHFRLRLEGLAREIDAGFGDRDLPEGLRALRQRIVSELDSPASATD